jgi:hypothetical protein
MKRILAVLMTTALMVMMMAMPASAALVNAVLIDVVDVNGNTIVAQVPVGVAANLCDINAAVLVDRFQDGAGECTATADSQASNGPGQGGGAR